MNLLRRFIGWVKANPWRFAIWLALSCANGFFMAWMDLPTWLVAFTFAVIALACYLDLKAMPAVLLCAALSAQPARAEEPEKGAAGVAVVVVVVGGVTIYLLVRTCQRLFPKTSGPGTNSPPYFIPGGTPDCAGAWTYAGWVSCYTPMDDSAPPMVTLELTGSVEPNGDLRLSAGRKLGAEEMLDPADFEKNLAEHGITFGTIGEKSYGLWGRPAYPEEVPIVFTEDASGNKGAIVVSTAPLVTVALERSPDMHRWTRIATSTLPIGSPLRIVDSTMAGQMFYRLVQP